MHAWRRLASRSDVARYLAAAGHPRLNIGCGSNIVAGWLNTDIAAASLRTAYLDAKRMDFIPAGSFDAVFCEHMIEHVGRADAVRMLEQIFRVLKPGGALRIVTPSLENLSRLVLDPAVSSAYLEWFRKFQGDPRADACDAVNAMFYGHGHRYIWSQRKLSDLLHAIGFRDVRAYPAGVAGAEVFRGVDHHGAVIGAAANALESVALEARRRDK